MKLLVVAITLLAASYTVANKVITLGDSYSSGTGIHNDADEYDEIYGGYVNPWKLTARSDNECWREDDTTPGPRYADENGMQSVFLACKGAEVSHVVNQIEYLHDLHPSDEANDYDGSVILLTAGGNDIRTVRGEDWPDLLVRCILDIFGCHDQSKNQVNNWAAIEGMLVDLFEKLATEASKATIRILGYPRMMQRDPGCSSVTGISRNEADWIDDQVDDLNYIIEAVVAFTKTSYPSVDMEFVDVTNDITIGACGPKSTRQVNDKVLTSSLGTSDSSFHPTQYGYDKYYDALIDSIPIDISECDTATCNRLKHVSSSQCPYNSAPNNGGTVNHWGCWNDDNMQYILDPATHSSGVSGYRIRHVASNTCWYAGSNDGDVINHWICWNDDNMVYLLDDAGSGYVRLRHYETGKCAYANGGNGGTMNSWVCWNDPNMRFQLI